LVSKKDNDEDEINAISKRRISIKNVIMRIVIDIRERKEKPKLTDLIAASKQQKQFKDMTMWKNKVIELYSDKQEASSQKKDENFNKLMECFNRVHQSLSQQQDNLSSLIKQVNGLIDRRDRNEDKYKKQFD
jgi:ABC-type branched-subunit amino acid transport system ATPase component